MHPRPSEQHLAALRADALRVRDGLFRLLRRLPPDGPARSGELTARLNHAGRARSGAPLFLHMACTAVAGKYEQQGRRDVAAEILRLRDADRSAQPLRLRRAFKRIGAHASRRSFGDPDLQRCVAHPDCIGHGATPWVCQQPDWRFRWAPEGLRRLRFMADCWDAYSRCSFMPDDCAIGLPQFPLADDLCPPLLHPTERP